jgi:hypothetical protein
VLKANLEQQRGQPPQPPTADRGAYSRSDRHITLLYEPDPYLFDEEQPRHGQFDDISLSRSMRTPAPTFTSEITFSEFKRDYINHMRAINLAFPEFLKGASPLDVDVNIACLNFQKRMF